MEIKDLFSLRENDIFKTLKELKKFDFVIIGGYAVNAYALPRFSVDCDIVIKQETELKKIEKILIKIGYRQENQPHETQYSGNFCRYEKKIQKNFEVSMDILFHAVSDRMTGAVFTADWIFQNSKMRILRGKTINEELKCRIINLDALIVMKMISCRSTDIRDVFMMLPNADDISWIKSEISLKSDLNDRLSKLIEKINSSQFIDGLSGVYGRIDKKTFEKHKKAISDLMDQ